MTEIVCALVNTCPKKHVLKSGALDYLLSELKLRTSELLTRYCILATLVSFCKNENSIKELCAVEDLVPYLCDSLEYSRDPQERKYMISLIHYMTPYIRHEVLAYYVLPIFELDNMCSLDAINLFKTIAHRRGRETRNWMHDNANITGIVKKIEKFMHEAEHNVLQILQSLFDDSYCCLANLASAVWNSSIRERLIHDMHSDHKKASVLMSISKRNTVHSLPFSQDELTSLKNSILSSSPAKLQAMYIMFRLRSQEIFHIVDENILEAYDNSLSNDELTTAQNEDINIDFVIFHSVINFLCFTNDDSLFHKAVQIVSKITNTHPTWFSFNYSECTLAQLNRMSTIATALGCSAVCEIKRNIAERVREEHVTKRLLSHGVQLNVPDDFKCPITQEIMKDPVVASDGHSYERSAIFSLMSLHGQHKSPLTREVLTNTFFSNHNLRKRIREYANDICDIIDKKPK